MFCSSPLLSGFFLRINMLDFLKKFWCFHKHLSKNEKKVIQSGSYHKCHVCSRKWILKIGFDL